jgi:hypothetical protein
VSSATELLSALDAFLESADGVKAVRRKRRLLAPIERKLERAMQKAFRTQGRAFASRFAALKDRFPLVEVATVTPPGESDWGPLFDDATLDTLKLFVEPLASGAAAALEAGAIQQIAQIGVEMSFTLENPRAVAYLEGHALDASKTITGTTRDEIARIVTQGVKEGWSYNRTAKAITDKYAEFAVGKPQLHIASRAHGIALYESGEAYEAGSYAVGEELAVAGLEMEHSWLTVKDGRVEPECRGNEAQGWIPLSQAFNSGHKRALAHYGCRCTCLQRRKPTEDA